MRVWLARLWDARTELRDVHLQWAQQAAPGSDLL